MSGTRRHPLYTHPLGGNSPSRYHPARAATHRGVQDARPELAPVRPSSASPRGFATADFSLRSRQFPVLAPAHPAVQDRRLAQGSDREGAPLLLGRPGARPQNPRSPSRRHGSLLGTLLTRYRSFPGGFGRGAAHQRLPEQGRCRSRVSASSGAGTRALAGGAARRRAVHTHPGCRLRRLEEARGHPQAGRLGEGTNKLFPFSALHTQNFKCSPRALVSAGT